eukprot:15433039-Alexandrium_andersonii.AAC.1
MPPTGKGGPAGGPAGATTASKAHMSSRSGWVPGGPSPSSTRGANPASATSGPETGPAGGTTGGSGP